MKILRTSFIVLSLAPFLALADQTLVCDEGPHLSVGIYTTSVFVPFDSAMVQGYDSAVVDPFLEENEVGISIFNSSLKVDFAPGDCTIDQANSSVLSSCHRNVGQKIKLDRSSITYSATNLSPAGTKQEITVKRPLQILSADLVLTLVDSKSDLDGSPSKRVRSDLNVVGRVSGKVRSLHLTRNEGEWTNRTDRSNYDRCVIE